VRFQRGDAAEGGIGVVGVVGPDSLNDGPEGLAHFSEVPVDEAALLLKLSLLRTEICDLGFESPSFLG